MEAALADLKAGKFVIVADDQNRENECDLILPADKVTPEAIAFMVRHTSGIICLSLLSERLEQLHLPQMVFHNTDLRQTAFTVSVDYAHGTTTGISAADRCKTIRALIDPQSHPHDFRRPGHIFPLRYCEGGVLKRAGHTEAAIDLARLAGCYPAGIICELVNEDGTMARIKDLEHFKKQHQLQVITIEELINYRKRQEKFVHCISEARLPTPQGEFRAYVYESQLDKIQHVALVKGDVRGKQNVLVRVHSECLTGDIFNSRRCDCGEQLNTSMEKIAQEGLGILIYLRGHEGRGIGLGHKLRAYHLQDQGRDTVQANEDLGFPVDSRDYSMGAQMLMDLGITTIRLLTNNPAKYESLKNYDLTIVERVPLCSPPTDENRHYLLTKKTKLGHLLDIE